MKKISEKNIKKIMAVLLTLIMVLCSIPLEQWMVRKVYAENEVNKSSIIEVVDNNSEVVSWATVSLSYEKGSSDVTEQKTLLYDREQKGYKLADDDYAALKDETLSNIKVSIEAEGFEKIIDDTSLITAVSDEKKSVTLTSNFSAPTFQIDLAEDASSYIYTGSSIPLIKSVTDLSKENVTKSTGESDNLSYITTTYEYKVEYSLDNETYQNDVPAGIDAGIYDVYVKVSEKASTYTHTDADFDKDTAVHSGDETKYIIKHKEVTIEKATLTNEQFCFQSISAGTQESNPILVEWNKQFIDCSVAKNVSDGTIKYKVKNVSKGEDLPNAINESGQFSFNEQYIDNTYQVCVLITNMQNYKDKEICCYIKVVKQNLDAIQFENIAKEDGNYKKTITYGDIWNGDKLVYGDKKEDVPNVKYEIVSQETLDGNSLKTIADIDKSTGTLTINRSGIVVVEATVDGSLYQDSSGNTYQYTLTIEKKKHDIQFEGISSPVEARYGDELKDYQAVFIDKDDKDDRKINEIIYTILDNNTVYDTKSTIDEKNGTVKINSVCADSEETVIVVTATLAANDKYAESTATYTIKSRAAEQTLKFEETTSANIYFGQNPFVRQATIKENGSESKNTVVYALKETDNTVKPIENNYISIDEDSGKILLDYEKIGEKTPDFTVEVIASLSGLVGEKKLPLYETTEKSYTLQYHQAAKDTQVHYTIQGTDNTDIAKDDLWYRKDVTLKASNGYLLATSLDGRFEDVFKDTLTFSESESEIQIYYRKKDTGIISIGNVISLKIDKEAPKGLQISYMPNCTFSNISNFDYKFGASANKTKPNDNQKYMKVKLMAQDTGSDSNQSGIYQFEYWGSALEDEQSNSKVVFSNKVTKPDEVSNTAWEVDGDKVSYIFTVPKQFKGKINFRAYDKAGNEVLCEDLVNDKTIITADDTAPKVTLHVDNIKNNEESGGSINSDRIMKLEIDDAVLHDAIRDEATDDAIRDIATNIIQYYYDNIKADMTYTPFYDKENEMNTKDIGENIKWDENDKNKGTTNFTDEGKYNIKVNSTDPAGNISEDTEVSKVSFKIDKTAPIISTKMEVVEEDLQNERPLTQEEKERKIVKNSVKLTVEVTENDDAFKPSEKINIQIGCKDINGTDIADEDTKKEIDEFQKSNWDISADTDKHTCTYTKSIILKQDARYNWIINGEDESKNKAEPIEEKIIIDKEEKPSLYKIEYSKAPKITMEIEEEKTIFFDEDEVTVTVQAKDSISGIEKLQYLTEDGNYTDIEMVQQTDKEGQKNIFRAVFSVQAQYKNLLSIQAIDKAGNNSTFRGDTIILDTIPPELSASFTTEEEPKTEIEEKAYNTKCINASIEVIEANFFEEDLQYTVDYTPFSNGKLGETQKNKKITIEWEGQTAKCKFTEEGKYEVVFGYEDKSGNPASKIQKVFYINRAEFETTSNLEGDYSTYHELQYYRTNVNYQIFVKENIFDESSLTIKAAYTPYNDDTSQEISEEICNAVKDTMRWDDKNQQFVGNCEIQKEGYYEISHSYISQAGETKEVTKTFYIGKTRPEIQLKYIDGGNADSTYKNYYKQARTAQIIINGDNFNSYNPFDPEKVSLVIQEKDNSQQDYTIVTDTYVPNYNKPEGWTDADGNYVKEVRFDKNADYKIELFFTNNAGISSKTENQIFTVDLKKPEVKVVFDNTDVRNENQFRSSRTAEITIVEHNFVPNRVEALITAVDANGELVHDKEGVVIGEQFKTYLQQEGSWNNNGDIHTAHITFEKDANYTFDIHVLDMAGQDNADSQKKNIVLYTGIACERFTIDTTAPTGSIKIADWTQSKDGTVWNKLLTKITFALWLQTDAEVVIDSDDTLSGIDYVRYYTSDYLLSEKDIKEIFQKQNTEAAWKEGSTFVMNPNTQFIVYAQIMDKAGNEFIISSDGVILDDIAPVGKDNEPPIIIIRTENQNQIYNQNVQLGIFVEEPAAGLNKDVYSGINKITYQVENKANNTITQEGTLYEFKNTNPTKEELVKEWSTDKPLVIEADKNNSDDIVVSVIAIDNAENSYKEELKLAIDVTLPEIVVSYDNNEGISYDDEYGRKTYFKAERTATIEIKERNFNADDVNINVTSTDGTLPNISDWTVVGGTASNGDDTIHRAIVHYYVDGDYTFDIAYNDMAGNPANDIEYRGLAPQQFTVDTVNPTISVSYGKNETLPRNSNWFRQARSAVVTVNEHNFDAKKVDVRITAKDMAEKDVDVRMNYNGYNSYADYIHDESNWKYNGDIHMIELNYIEDAHYTFDISMTDLAGRSNDIVDYQDSNAPTAFIVDKSVPVVVTTYTSSAAAVNENHYNQNMDLQFTISENNFYREDTKVEVVYTPYNGAVNENYGDSVTKSLEWENPTNSDTWTAKATYTFADEGKYTVTISYTDKAGNINKNIEQKEFYIDKTLPEIQFEYLSQGTADSAYTSYYKQARMARITIKENDFNPKNIELHILRRLNSEQVYTDVAGIYAVNYNELDGWTKEDNGFIKSIEFNEDADYEMTLSFTDDAGNYADIERQTFTVDLTAPQVNVTFSNMDVRNENEFRSSRTAEITIVEHNFVPNRVNAFITAVDANGELVHDEKDVVVGEQFGTYLQQADSWENRGDIHTAHIVFEEDANYTFDIYILDMAGQNNADSKGENIVSYTGIACKKFTIDTTTPTGSIKIADWTQSKDETVWNKFLTNITFALWLQTDAAVVIDSDDRLSGIEYVRYYVVDHPVEEEAVKALPDSAWTEGSSFRMESDARFIVYAWIMDNAGNEIIISSDGVILDNTKPAGDGTMPRITIRTEDRNNIYNQDVRLDIYVEDPLVGSSNVYSGIQEITCTVTNMATDVITQNVTLYKFENNNPKQEELVREWTSAESFVVDQSANNSNDVVVAVTAVDNAGNSSTQYLPLAIDVTAPRIEIRYDNDDGDSSFEETTYFKAERTATVDIIERNFNADDVNINVTSTDGTLPDISDWTVVGGTASNGDDTIHRATVHYYADGDYTFDIAYTDIAGNAANDIEYNGLATQQFTIDSVLPVISVVYDNNNSVNGNYYNQARTATVTIEEHNFETSRIVPEITAEGGTANVPQLSDWSGTGDTHTATISYTGDTLYGFNLQYTDMAGNQAEAYERENFYVDMTMPELSIQRIENESANKEEVIAPVLAFSDQYYDRIDITLNGENADGMGYYDLNENGGTFTFNNIAKDDIYTLSASVFDKAGNPTQEQITFSVNRNGSTYDFDTSTEKINGSYIKETSDIVVYEINPDPLLTHKVTLYKNGKTVLLTEGTDYSVNVDGGGGNWYKYIYNIFAKNFDDDGVYRLSVQSTDKAGNIAENTIDTKNKEISFGVDNTLPNIMLLNLESGKTYAMNSLNVLMSISDNLKLSSVLAYVDDVLVREWLPDEIIALINANEDFAFDIDGTSTNAHTVRIVAVDAAGNALEMEAKDFYVTTNMWIRFYTNTFLFWGSIGSILFFAAGIIGIVVIKKRKKKQQG